MDIESIFSHAVALDQSGRMKNVITCNGRDVWIMNYDKTILLKFQMDQLTPPFKHLIRFNANDYDSVKFYEEDGKIVFVQQGHGFERKKICAPPADIIDPSVFWQRLAFDNKSTHFTLSDGVLSLLDENLSHTEIHSEDKKLVITQRDVFTGNIIRLDRKVEGLLGLNRPDKIAEDFEVIAIRTNDLAALFSFSKSVVFYLNHDNPGRCMIKSDAASMEGLIAWCVYDELGIINYLEVDDGGQKQENRDSEQKANRKIAIRRKC
jgi:hypothetical protein